MTLPPGTLLAGRYRIEGVLGAGGMGTVYRATDARLAGRAWAVKEMSGPRPGDPDHEACLRGFRAEAELLASLHHPRLPRVVDSFECDEREYLVMDLVAGRDLRRVLEEDGPPPPDVALRWAISVLEVLDYLHSRRPPVVVRDLKPSNLVLTPAGDVVLVDFGIARTLQPGSRTATLASGVGSPGYAPPEQYARGNTDPRSDLYALGATLYHLLTGREPVESVQVAAGLAEWEPPSRHRPLRAGTDEVVRRAMAPRLEDRPPDAASLRRDLEALLDEEEANRRAALADLRGPAPPVSAESRLPSRVREAMRRRFVAELGWTEREMEGFDLALEGQGLVPPLVLVAGGGDLSEETAESLFAPLVRLVDAQAGFAPRTVYVVLAAARIPNPVSVEDVARRASSLRGWRRVLALPLDLERGRLLDGFVPAGQRSDNDARDPLLNLGAVAGSLRR